MKKSIRYLPKKKQQDLNELIEIILNTVLDCEMIILYGSYARNDYVDYDQRTEYGVKTYYMSDYDILILTEKILGCGERTIYTKMIKQYYNHKSIEFHTRPQFINESVEEFNSQVEKSQYFYTDIVKQGVMLYNSGKYKIAHAHKLNYSEIREIAQEYFGDVFSRANSFLRSARHDIDDQDLKMAAFHLHQAAENYLRAVPLVYILYGYKEHDLKFLQDKAKTHHLDICKAFPLLCKEDERLFKLLQDSYVQARYNKDFVVTMEDINVLITHVEHLRDLTKQICENKLAEYSRLGKKE